MAVILNKTNRMLLEKSMKDRYGSNEKFIELMNAIQYEEDYINSNSFKVDYKQATREAISHYNTHCSAGAISSAQSNINLVKLILCEGFTVDDIKSVTEFVYKKWKGTQFESYCKPNTIWELGKFAGYFDELKKTKNPSSQIPNSGGRQW